MAERLGVGPRGHLVLRLALSLVLLWALLLLLQNLFLGSRAPSRLGPAPEVSLAREARPVVPRLVHYTWYSAHRHRFRFHHLISVLSARRFLRPSRIFLWCESPPRGRWWREARTRVPELRLRLRPAPTAVFGRPIRIPEHQSDVVRLMVLLEHGGVYLDLDVIILRPLDTLLHYNVTMGYQLDHSGLCNGLILARRGDRFLQTWFDEYRYFLDRQWDFHSVQLPDLLAKQYPHWVHVEARTFHRPNFFEIEWIYTPGKIYPWRRNYAMHLWYRFYNVDHSPRDIRRLNSTLGQMFRFIFYGSPRLLSDASPDE